jgi:hypothetical protein
MLGFETKSIVGATVDDLKATYPGVFVEEKPDPGEKDGTTSYWFEIPPAGYDKFWTRIAVSLEKGVVDRVWFSIPYEDVPASKAEFLAAIDKAWGKGAEVEDITGRKELQWLEPASGRRATLDQSYEGNLQLELTPYLPLEKLLGEGTDKLGFETTPIIGLTWAELAKAYPQYAAAETDEEAAKKRKDLENFMGEDKDKLAILGEAKGGTTFNLPGTELDNFTLVQLRYDDAGKVQSYSTSISYRGDATAKDRIKAAFEKKWGAAKAVDHYGDTELVLREAGPRVTARDSDILKAWTLEVGGTP